MQDFRIVRESTPGASFRVAAVRGKFDLSAETIQEVFEGSIVLPESWNVGLIVGRSGSGKSTIAGELFGQYLSNAYEYSGLAVVDDMPKHCSVDEITQAFTSVGFASVPSWLKPYSVLSNGEKMRADIARALLENKEITVFDEFTSVVDRQVAQFGSFATQKAVRKTNRKFIAVTCHYDVEEWLLPDWVFDCNTMTFRTADEMQKKNRPGVSVSIYRVRNEDKQRLWSMFAKYHYLGHNHNSAAEAYLVTVNGTPAGWCSVLHFPHPKSKNIKKIHRLVVFPDFQGIGLGAILTKTVGSMYLKKGFRVSIVTSNPGLIHSMSKDRNYWKCTEYGFKTGQSRTSKEKSLQSSLSSSRITASFELKRIYEHGEGIN